MFTPSFHSLTLCISMYQSTHWLILLHRMLPTVLRRSSKTQPPTRASSLSEYAAVRWCEVCSIGEVINFFCLFHVSCFFVDRFIVSCICYLYCLSLWEFYIFFIVKLFYEYFPMSEPCNLNIYNDCLNLNKSDSIWKVCFK